jgi:hypothetical protein
MSDAVADESGGGRRYDFVNECGFEVPWHDISENEGYEGKSFTIAGYVCECA